MSVKLITYVGPFLECQRGDVDEERWEHILMVGLDESCEPGEKMIFIPNRDVPGIQRETEIDRHAHTDVLRFSATDITDETWKFGTFIAPLILELNEANAWYRISWGVVPRWW